jgi:hypothetical protein
MRTALCVLAFVQIVFANSIFAVSENKKQAATDLAMVKQYAKAQAEVAKGVNSKTPDWTAIKAQYELTLPVIKEIDVKYTMHYADELHDALKKCAAGGKEAEVGKEVVGKAYQHITVLAIQQELDSMANGTPADMKADDEKITVYFEVIRPTFARRDKGFFNGQKTLEAAADAALAQLAKADKTELLAASRELEDVIARTYALSVLYEVKEIERLRDSDIPLAERHQVEAKMYYRIIRPKIEKRNTKTNEVLQNTLNGSFGAMNSQSVEKYLTEGLGIKLR